MIYTTARHKSSTKYREKAAKRRLNRIAKQAKKRNDGNESIAGAGDKHKTSNDVQSGSASAVAATSNKHNDDGNNIFEGVEDGDTAVTPHASLSQNDQPAPRKYAAEEYMKKVLSRIRSLGNENNRIKKEGKRILAERETEIARLDKTVQNLQKTAHSTMKQIADLNAAMFYLLHKGPSPGAVAAATAASASARAADAAPRDAKVSVDGEAASAGPDPFREGYVSADTKEWRPWKPKGWDGPSYLWVSRVLGGSLGSSQSPLRRYQRGGAR